MYCSVRSQVEVKLLPQGQELYVLARSQDRRHKERAMRRRKLKTLWQRLKELQQQKRLKRDEPAAQAGSRSGTSGPGL